MSGRWSKERANAWYAQQPWLVGCNFIPSTAVNQLELWQAATFDPETIRRELGWAADLGMNTVRVYLHDLVWEADAAGFKSRIDTFLSLAAARNIRTLFVLFDDCWNGSPQLGPQSAPVPGVHNSGWVTSPARDVVNDPSQWGRLKRYVQDILNTFGQDERVLLWDLYNEVGNRYLRSLSLPQPRKAAQLLLLSLQHRYGPNPSLDLLKETFRWAWEVGASQPLTSCIWISDPRLNLYLLETVDVITFHNYENAARLEKQISDLQAHDRPLLCTEYLARDKGSLFETHLPIFEAARVGCYHWGLVSGKTQTIYSWKDRAKDRGSAAEPNPWYHDMLRVDGTPYRATEVALIKRLTRGSSVREQT